MGFTRQPGVEGEGKGRSVARYRAWHLILRLSHEKSSCFLLFGSGGEPLRHLRKEKKDDKEKKVKRRPRPLSFT